MYDKLQINIVALGNSNNGSSVTLRFAITLKSNSVRKKHTLAEKLLYLEYISWSLGVVWKIYTIISPVSVSVRIDGPYPEQWIGKPYVGYLCKGDIQI